MPDKEPVTQETTLNSVDKIMQNSVDTIKKNFTRDKIKQYYIEHYPTGFDAIDQLLGGGLYYGLTIFGAIPGLGKSTMALQMAYHMATYKKDGPPVLYISLEMPAARLVSKIVSNQIFQTMREENGLDVPFPDKKKLLELVKSSVKSNAIMTEGGLSDEQWNRTEKIVDSINGSNLYIIERDNPNFSAENVVKLIAEYKQHLGKTPIVFLDYLQILSPINEHGTDKQIVDKNITTLNSYANANKVPLFVISSLNRQSYTKRVSMSDFKESGSIEYTAAIMFSMQHTADTDSWEEVQRENEKIPRELTVNLIKQRYGTTGDVLFNFYSPVDYFECLGFTGSDTKNTTDKKPSGKKLSQNKDNASSRKKKPPKTKPASDFDVSDEYIFELQRKQREGEE